MNSYGFVPTVGTVEQAEGARVAAPAKTWSCFAVVTHLYGVKLATPRSCKARARCGRLTCLPHAGREDEAQALKASLGVEGCAGTRVRGK